MLSQEWLSAFVPIGILHNDNWNACGAGILFLHNNYLWVITANHVLAEKDKGNIAILFNKKDGTIEVFPLSLFQEKNKTNWARNDKEDLACCILPVFKHLEFKALSSNNCLSLSEVFPTMQSYTIGCPYGLHGVDPNSALPLVLGGIISGKNPQERMIYTSTPTFPGNSGGPLIAIRSPINPSGGIVVGRPTVFLVGVVLQTSLMHDPNKQIPALHLGIAKSTDAVLELLNSEEAKIEIEKIHSLSKP